MQGGGLWGESSAAFDDADVAFNFVFQRLLQKPEGVEIFYFDLGAEFARAARPHAHIGVATQRAFFHVAITDAGVEQNLPERGQIRVGLFGRAHVRLGDDFAERRAATVVIDVGLGGRLPKTVVPILGGVFFEVQTRYADALFCAVVVDFDPAAGGQRQLVLGVLIALGQVGIAIYHSREPRLFVNSAIQRQRDAYSHF